MDADVNVLIVTEEGPIAADLLERLKSRFPRITRLHPGEVRREISRIQPDLVLLHEGPRKSELENIPLILKEIDKVEVVLLTESKDSIRVRDASRAGAFDVLFFPDEINALGDVLSRAIKSLRSGKRMDSAKGVSTWGRGQVIAFYSGKGGTGKSLVASTLAQTLQLESSSSVLLVDLNFQYGGVETFLGVDGGRSLHDLTPVLDELNDNHIRSVTVVERHSQMEVLVSPLDLSTAVNITEEHVERLLRAARLYYDYILVDVPTEMTPITYATLEEADRIFYVLNPDALSLRVLGRVLATFSSVGVDPEDRLQLVLNRVNRDSEITVKDIRHRFPYEVIAELRDDPKRVDQAVNRGKPLRTAQEDKNLGLFARDVQKLAKIIMEAGKRLHV
ncbi:AAA family ATPase [Staphylospora marina]|uniref:AAA family ATPase n=1 Tax=Staphylospora marina TaxID=2490858 RepID=UPI0013DDF5DB|nr:AAA family ATPase [Staphylospora marina]